MAEEKVSELPKPWPLGGYAPGNYMCVCVHCEKQFEGDKRAVSCLECAASRVNAALARRPAPVTEDVGEWVTAKLPCDVTLPPATVIRAGCKVETLLAALEARGMTASPSREALASIEAKP